MSAERYEDADLRRILDECRTIAMVGASPSPARDSHRVMRYLQQQGYRVIPVNPHIAGETLAGETAYATLADVPEPFRLVDLFRRSEAVPGIVDEILALQNGTVRVIWMQLGVSDSASAARARAAGLQVVMNRCMKAEHIRLMRGRGTP